MTTERNDWLQSPTPNAARVTTVGATTATFDFSDRFVLAASSGALLEITALVTDTVNGVMTHVYTRATVYRGAAGNLVLQGAILGLVAVGNATLAAASLAVSAGTASANGFKIVVTGIALLTLSWKVDVKVLEYIP